MKTPLGAWVSGVGSAATAMVDELSPGQRWTSALMLMMATAVLAFGLPSPTIVLPSAAQRIQPGAPVPAPAPASAPEELAASLPIFRNSGPAASLITGGGSTAAIPGPSVIPIRPDIVALVRSDPTRLGRDDASIAGAFLGNSRFNATVIELTDDDTLCATVAEAGQLVIAGHGLPAHLRDCLVERAVTIVAYDALGSVAPIAGLGQVFSTRRGHHASLVDLGRWALETSALGTTPGLVASAQYRNEVDTAIDDLARMGIQFEEVRFIPDGPQREQEILSGVQAFTGAGVDSVLFAADVDDQARWVEVQRLLGSNVSYVVSDVGDAIVEEGYPSFFADARAHTSVRTPWWERRDAGATAAQQECRAHWEGSASPGAPPSGSELLLAYVWCQHVRMIVEPALDLVDRGTELVTAIRNLEVESPATSILGRFGLFEWGPRHDVVLAWDGACGCWQPDGSFSSR